MKIKITRQSLFNLLPTFETLKDLQGAKFAYAVVKNKEKIKREVIEFNKTSTPKPTKEYQEWEKARISVCQEHCTKKDNKPVIENNKFVGLEKNPKFEKVLNKLKVKFKETLGDYQKQVSEYRKKLAEEIEFDVHTINKRSLPEKISPKQLEAIMPLIKEEHN